MCEVTAFSGVVTPQCAVGGYLCRCRHRRAVRLTADRALRVSTGPVCRPISAAVSAAPDGDGGRTYIHCSPRRQRLSRHELCRIRNNSKLILLNELKKYNNRKRFERDSKT